MSQLKKHSEPLFHITKRSEIAWWKSLIIRLIAIMISLAVCSEVIVVLTKIEPLKVFKSMYDGSFGTERRMWVLFQNSAILLCISLAVTPAFKMKFWNLGAEGQTLVGGLAAAACMQYLEKSNISNSLMLPLMLLVSLLAGMLWGLIPAIAKAKWNTNESLFTLMMNYVAMQLVGFFIMLWRPKGSNVMGNMCADTKLGWLPELFGKKQLITVLVVIAVTVIMFIYLKYSKQGYEISVVGESENTARYIGINVNKVIIRTMLISAAVCGLAGFLLVSGVKHTVSKEIVGGMGFTAILVSWLAKFNPAIMVITSFLITFLQIGAGRISTDCHLNNDSIGDVLTGIIIFFIIGCEFFINYRINVRSYKGGGK